VFAAFAARGLKADPVRDRLGPLRATDLKAKADDEEHGQASKLPAGGATVGVGNVAEGPGHDPGRPIPISAGPHDVGVGGIARCSRTRAGAQVGHGEEDRGRWRAGPIWQELGTTEVAAMPAAMETATVIT
jgi:hypothetical protein